MDIVFADSDLAEIEGVDAGKTGFPVSVIRAVRKKLTAIRASPDDRTLRNWKSLHYEKLKGDRAGQRSIRVNEKYRIVFTLDSETVPQKATILAIEDYH